MADLQQWLYRIQPVRPEMLTEGPTPEEAAITEQHFDYLNDLIGKGILILAGRTQNTGYTASASSSSRRKTRSPRARLCSAIPACV